MKFELVITKSFKKDYKKLSKDEILETDKVIITLLKGEKLDSKYKDHELRGNYTGYRECHVKPDLLLVYKTDKDDEQNPKKVLYLTALRINSHSNIFSTKKRI